MGRVFWTLVNTAKYGCMVHCIKEYVIGIVQCEGPSMSPALHTKDLVLTEPISVNKHRIIRGDIVICRSPTTPGQQICKRVVAFERENVIANRGPCRGKSFYVPKGHVWLEGDNGECSLDSNYYGAVPYGLIKSRVFCRLWPPTSLKELTTPGIMSNSAICADDLPTDTGHR